jgi:hypothetical protein
VLALTPFSDPEEVLLAIRPVSDRIHLGLHSLLPVTRSYFDGLGLPLDKALHAMLTRHRLKHLLLEQQIRAEDEVTEENMDFSVKGISNCGLIVSAGNCVLRVLKCNNCELPPAGSNERYEFYQRNLAFPASDSYPGEPMPRLNLVAAWNTTSTHDLGTFSIVCPFGQSEKAVANKWWKTLMLPRILPVLDPMPAEPTLEEITPKLDTEMGLESEKPHDPETDRPNGLSHDAD